ncbi:MAG TPA: GntR family transcriptional regulator [Firmicutes bacterium]|jgi:DNA-binding GntR family transcriptional regulator|nr:GntR family transcriptional regulator [Bacillota bacterium]
MSENPLTEIRRQPSLALHERVYRALRRSIISGIYEPGQRLTEEEVAGEAGVSRTPVREAFRLLASDGFVEYSRNRGVVVIDFGVDEIWDMWRLRASLEGLAAELAAERITGPEIDELGKLLDGMKMACEAQDWDQMTDLLMEFDDVICTSARAQPLIAMFKSLQSITWDLRSLVHTSPMRNTVPYSDHVKIYKAICEGDGEKARRLTEDHVLQWGKVFVQEYRKNHRC